MKSTILTIGSMLCLSFAALPAQAGSVVHEGGQFQLLLPETFRITRTEKGLQGLSKSGNVKVFARSEATAAKAYDFTGHFARWETLVTSRGIYQSLRRISDRKQVSGDGRAAVFRVYDAVSMKTGKAQPYRVITLAAFNPTRGRIYTLAIASHFDTFLKYGGQLRSIASSFLPLGARAATKRLSMRGKFLRRGGQLVSLVAKAPAARPAAQAAPRPVNASTLLGATVRPAGLSAIRPAPGHQRLVVPAGARATRPASILPRPATLPVQTAPGKLLLKDLRKTPAKPAVVTGVHQVSTLR